MIKNKLKIQTPEELKQSQLQHAYSMIELDSTIPLQKTPAYEFRVGEEVALGHLHKVTIESMNPEKTIYELKVEDKNGELSYRVVQWWEIRPKMDKEHLPERIGVKSPVDIRYNNSTIESLLHSYYHAGIDLEPDYQRDFVWTQEDKDYLIDSIFHSIEIGRFVLNRLNNQEWAERSCLYEILDGKQRLNTLCEFYENRFPYKGLYFNDLHPLDKNMFLEAKVAVGEVSELTRQQVLETFLAVNRGGRQMDIEHLRQVEEQLKQELESDEFLEEEQEYELE